MFQSIGERFNIGITLVLRKLKKCANRKKANVTQTELTIVASVLCSAVLLGGAGAFHHFEGWDLMDAFYYCFITMSTIGFGDFVALQNPEMEALKKKPDYVAFSILYILFGLTVFAAALNLMVLRLLTMNTEDERKDELQAQEARRKAVKVDGDVITRETQSVMVSPLEPLEEGIRIEAVQDDSNLYLYNSKPFRAKEAPRISNGGISNYLSMRNNGTNPIFAQTSANPGHSWHPPSNAKVLESKKNEEKPKPQVLNSPTTMLEGEEIVGLETVLYKKRGSV